MATNGDRNLAIDRVLELFDFDFAAGFYGGHR